MDTRPGERIAEEQAALRRVAVLAARGAPPEEVFAAVAAEAGQLLGADRTALARYDPDRTMLYVARWDTTGGVDRDSGLRIFLRGRNVSTRVLQTGRPARMDDFSQASGPPAEIVRRFGIRSGVGVPIRVEGRLWGVMLVSATSETPLPPDTEDRLAGFTELAGTAIANAQARVDLRAYADEQAALRRVATLVARGNAARGRVRRGRRRSRAAARRRPDRRGPVRPGRRGDGARRVEQHRRRHALHGGQPDEPWRAEHGHAGFPGPRSRCASTTTATPPARPLTSDATGGTRGGRRADHRRGTAVGRHDRRLDRRRAAAAGHRGAAGRLHRAGRHRDRQRPGTRGPARLRRGTGRAAPGRHAGGPRGGAGGGVRRGRRRSRAAARRRFHGHEPVRRGRHRHGRRDVDQDGCALADGDRRPAEPRRAQRDHAGVRERRARADRRLPAVHGHVRRGAARAGGSARRSACRSAWRGGCGVW